MKNKGEKIYKEGLKSREINKQIEKAYDQQIFETKTEDIERLKQNMQLGTTKQSLLSFSSISAQNQV